MYIQTQRKTQQDLQEKQKHIINTSLIPRHRSNATTQTKIAAHGSTTTP